MIGLTLSLAAIIILVLVCVAHFYNHKRKREQSAIRRCSLATLTLQEWCRAHPNKDTTNPDFRKFVSEALIARAEFRGLFREEYDDKTEFLQNLLGKEKVVFIPRLRLI